MGVGASNCKGLVYPSSDGANDDGRRTISTVDRLPYLPAFEDREPFQPGHVLCERDLSLLKALTHHRTPFAVVEIDTQDLKVVYASGGWVAGMRMPAENVEGTGFGGVLKKGIKAADADIERLVSAMRSKQDLSLVVKGSTGRRNSRNVPYTQFFATPVADEAGQVVYTFVSLQPVAGPEAEPSQTMDRREMFCITDPDLYDNPIVFVSDDFVDMTGYDREEINGINCRFLQGEMTSSEDVDVIRYGLREQTDMRVCLLNYRKNGTAFLNQFNLSPLRDVSGNLAFFIGVQIEVEDAEVMPFPTTRQTLQEMLLDEEEKDFWDDAELAPAQEPAKASSAPPAKVTGAPRTGDSSDVITGGESKAPETDKAEGEVKIADAARVKRGSGNAHPMEG